MPTRATSRRPTAAAHDDQRRRPSAAARQSNAGTPTTSATGQPELLNSEALPETQTGVPSGVTGEEHSSLLSSGANRIPSARMDVTTVRTAHARMVPRGMADADQRRTAPARSASPESTRSIASAHSGQRRRGRAASISVATISSPPRRRYSPGYARRRAR
jgi:hypothetical protein